MSSLNLSGAICSPMENSEGCSLIWFIVFLSVFLFFSCIYSIGFCIIHIIHMGT